jgi:hypothetical protein
VSTRRNVLAVMGLIFVGGASANVREADAQPAAVNISGNWTTQFAGAAAAVSLTQVRGHVVGTYVNTAPLLPGAMAGVMRGRTLTGRWTDASSSGGFVLVFSADGNNFVGTWGRSVASNTDGGPWIGQRR